jgi:Flp pilus assembly protein TadD
VGRADKAIEGFVRGTAGPDGLPWPSSGLAILYARAGRLDEARVTLEEVQALAREQFVSPYGIASYYAVIGDNDRARLAGEGVRRGAMERWCGSRCTGGSMAAR